MRPRHRRRAYRRLPVTLGVVALVDLGVVAAKPDSADRKPGIAVPFGNARFLQQGQRAAACADEHKFCRYRSFLAAFEIVYFDAPPLIALAHEVGDAVPVMHLTAWLADEMSD